MAGRIASESRASNVVVRCRCRDPEECDDITS